MILTTLLACSFLLASGTPATVAGSPSIRSERGADNDNEVQELERLLKMTKPCLANTVNSNMIRCFISMFSPDITKLIKETAECKDQGISNTQCKMMANKIHQQNYTRCLLGEFKAINAATDEIDTKAMKESIIGSSTLSDAEKQSAMKTFDDCVAAPVPTPYSSFHYKNDQIPTSFKEIATLITQTRSIGTLEPCKLIVANDCMDVSLMHNGCVPSDEAVIKELKKEHEDFLKSVS